MSVRHIFAKADITHQNKTGDFAFERARCLLHDAVVFPRSGSNFVFLVGKTEENHRGHAESMNVAAPYPSNHAGYLGRCHKAGQNRPTPLLLQYGPGDYNCLHQDLYGDLVFPLQVTLLLSRPGEDFTGGEFVLTEQRPRMQSRAEVVPLVQGEAVIFPVHHRPVRGTRGTYRVNMRHGVSRLRSGHRHTLGIIFHDAA